MILLRRITILRDLHRVEAELRFQVRRLVLRIPDRLAKLRPQLRIVDGDGPVDGRVAGYIRRIVRQGSQGESVLVDVLAFEQQLTNKVSAPDVVHKIAELPAAERVVAEILDNGASVRVGVGILNLVFRQSRIALEQERPNRSEERRVGKECRS